MQWLKFLSIRPKWATDDFDINKYDNSIYSNNITLIVVVTQNLIRRFDNCMKEYCSFIYEYYQPPLLDKEIVGLVDKMGIEDEDYESIYKWKNGLDIFTSEKLPKEFTIGYCGNFISLDNAELRFQQINKKRIENPDDVFWDESKVIIMDNLIGEYLLFENNKGSEDYGALFQFSPSGSNACLPVMKYDNIESMLESIIACFENGAIWFDKKSGYLVIDFDKESEICSRINPLSTSRYPV